MTDRPVAVILAGGRGTRMGELTDTTPKPLLPVAGEPLLAHSLRRLAAVGITEAFVAVSYLAEQFPDVLGDGSRYGVTLTYVDEGRPRGTGGALAHVIDAVGWGPGTPVVALNGDLLSAHDLDAHVAQFRSDREQGALLTMHVRGVSDTRAYGAVTLDEHGEVLRFEEKLDLGLGMRAGLINAGTYVLDPVLLQPTSRDGVASFEREVLPAALKRGQRITAFSQEAPFLDVGTPNTLELAKDFLRDHPSRPRREPPDFSTDGSLS